LTTQPILTHAQIMQILSKQWLDVTNAPTADQAMTAATFGAGVIYLAAEDGRITPELGEQIQADLLKALDGRILEEFNKT